MHKTASTTVPVHPLIAERWSPRGFNRAHELDEDSLTALLEAARWAPSAQNSQPWRFLVARRGDEAHEQLFAALAPGNQAWAGAASALVLVAARTVADDGRPQPWALYDTGQAVAALITQAQADGLAVHQMGGFDTAAVRAEFGLGETLTPVVVIAVGRRDLLPELSRLPRRSLILVRVEGRQRREPVVHQRGNPRRRQRPHRPQRRRVT